jgi:hypothetical protein
MAGKNIRCLSLFLGYSPKPNLTDSKKCKHFNSSVYLDNIPMKMLTVKPKQKIQNFRA